jgi:hypothetical protein
VVGEVEEVVYVLNGLELVFHCSHEDAHENIAHGSADVIFEKQRVFTMADCSLKKSLCSIVADGSGFMFTESNELVVMVQKVIVILAELRVGLFTEN